jgi:hypothetical protein
LVGAVNALDAELSQTYNLISDLVHILETNLLLNQEIEMQDQLISTLLPFVQVANIWAQDALMHEQVLENVCALLTNPGFLVYWAFKAWKETDLTEFDQDTIAEQYLSLLAAKGKYPPPSPQFPGNFAPNPQFPGNLIPNNGMQFPPSPMGTPQIPFPPVPSNGMGQQPSNGVYAIINALRNPQGSDTARSLVRARNAGVL